MERADEEVCGDCGTILGDRIVDTRSECESPIQ